MMLQDFAKQYSAGGAVDADLATYIENFQRDRLRTFFDELEAAKIPPREDLIRSEDFLHAYFATVRAVLNTRRREKIQLFAKLFSSYVKGEHVKTVDGYEEYLAVLDDLSYREFQVLLILHRCEQKTPRNEGENDFQWASQFWQEFLEEVSRVVGLPQNQIPGMLARLNRTGLYKTLTGISGDMGALTPNFQSFILALGINESTTL